MDFSGSDFAKLKYTDAYLLLIRRDQSHLDSRTDLTSTWLYPKIFHRWIKNLDSLTSKYSELFVSHRGDLKSKGYLYPYPSRDTLDSRILHNWSFSVWMYSYILPHAIPVSLYSLVKKITNPYGTQRSTLDIVIILVITIH